MIPKCESPQRRLKYRQTRTLENSMTIPDAFLSGRLVDENGLPPLTARFTVLTDGNVQGQRGFVRVQGDHMFRSDGTFASPPLFPGRYFLRFFGMLQGGGPASGGDKADRQRRVFDFIYPDADAVSKAEPFDIRAGETMSSVFAAPEPTWFNIAGCVRGSFPVENHSHISVLFKRNMGILPDVGASGFPVKIDRSFEGMLLRGSYVASLHEMTNPDPSGYTRSLRQFSSAELIIERDTLNLELPLE
jgi:hypothetical protein